MEINTSGNVINIQLEHQRTYSTVPGDEDLPLRKHINIVSDQLTMLLYS